MRNSRKFRWASQTVAACAVAIAWVILGYGLRSQPDPEAWSEFFEAGGRFAAFIGIYLPFYLLAPVLAVVVVLALVSTRDWLSGLLTTAAIGVALFEGWVAMIGGPLFQAQPHLMASLIWCVVADGVAIVALVGVWLTHTGEPTRAVNGVAVGNSRNLRRASQTVAACAVAIAWVILGYGLRSQPDPEGWGELEAGGRGAAGLFIYLPFYLLAPVLAVVVVLALVSTRDWLSGLLTTTTVGVGLFGCWVALIGGPLVQAQPDLPASLIWCVVADGVAFVALVGVWLTRTDKPTRAVNG
ncbi:hypothetical protein ACFFMM_28475 [Micromonospora chaiyaphumensis]|uniref:hypothetical protein n=1 Tax=Micromonospora chaiyaphumensis TaxID=307119 RepID=UPI00111305A0|nr:hypothetical protein [Micromonospora chaiyaphumensis]